VADVTDKDMHKMTDANGEFANVFCFPKKKNNVVSQWSLSWLAQVGPSSND
jgi:hypothetical protein